MDERVASGESEHSAGGVGAHGETDEHLDVLNESDVAVGLAEAEARFWPRFLRAAFIGLIGVALGLIALLGFPAGPVWVEVFARLSSGAAAILLVIAGVRLVRDVRNGPVLRSTEEGLHVRPDGGMRFFIPFSRYPAPEMIPWSAIRSIEEGPMRSIIIDYEGYEPSVWRRILPTRRDLAQGRLVSLMELGEEGVVMGERLVAWSDERLALRVRRDAALRAVEGDRTQPD